MAKFANSSRQAASVMKGLQGSVIRSVGTTRNYEKALKRITDHMKSNRLGSLRDITPESAVTYLKERAETVGQKTLDMERQALQSMMQHITKTLPEGKKLAVVKSTASPNHKTGSGNHGRRLSEQSRAYTREQVELISTKQSDHNALATRIAHASGLRAHELLTLSRLHRQQPDVRPKHQRKFNGIYDQSLAYTVKGKGGLIREIRIPIDLARQLEARRLATPRIVIDRGISYKQTYNIGGGQPWSNSFSSASKSALGWSNGGHGLRHSYAQNRMAYMQKETLRDEAKLVVSQELGHFRPEITEVYLR
tara:strand:+ start:1188 stop:2111 length:924 start_codon:yes stop_codon:yes gene_type:complete